MQSTQIDYQRYLTLIRRRKELFITLALLIMTAAFVVSYLLPRKYESSSTVFIEKSVISELVKGLTVVPSLEDTTNVLTYKITSRALLARVIDTMDLGHGKSKVDRDRLIKKLQQHTKVKVKDNNLFTISFSDSNPRVARDFVNTLIRMYIEDNISSKRGETYEAANFLTDQMKNFSVRLEKAESQVNAYKMEKGAIIALDEGKLFQEISLAREKLYDLELRRRQLEGMRQVTRKADDPLQVRLSFLQKRLEELLVQYTDNYPEVVQVKGEMETLRQQLKGKRGKVVTLDSGELGKLNAEIGAIKISEDGLRRSIATNTNLMKQIPSAKAGLERLEVEKQNQKNIYDQLFARHGQSEVSRQMEVQDKSTTFRVVDPAVLPLKPSSPNRLKIMLMGIIGGIAGSFSILLLLEQVDDSVKDVEFVKGLGAPVLAVIPRMVDPALVARQRMRSLCFFGVCGIYLLLMLWFPLAELLDLPYMDRVLDQINSAKPVSVTTGQLR